MPVIFSALMERGRSLLVPKSMLIFQSIRFLMNRNKQAMRSETPMDSAFHLVSLDLLWKTASTVIPSGQESYTALHARVVLEEPLRSRTVHM